MPVIVEATIIVETEHGTIFQYDPSTAVFDAEQADGTQVTAQRYYDGPVAIPDEGTVVWVGSAHRDRTIEKL